MKRVIIALLLCFVFSSEIQAKKVLISSASAGTYTQVPATVNNTCMYQITSTYQASVHVHKTNAVEFRALVGDEVQPPMVYRYFSVSKNMTVSTRNGTWEADSGEVWSLVWVLQRTKGKGHVIDAVEMESGTCTPLPD